MKYDILEYDDNYADRCVPRLFACAVVLLISKLIATDSRHARSAAAAASADR